MTISVVLADANILFSRTLRDYVLYVADEGAIEVHWSREILTEMSRNLRKNLGFSQESTARLEQLMNDFIEYALVEIDPGDLVTVETVEMDAKDRHVLAAALSADADILLTDNTKDFPARWMTGQGIELLTSGQLLTRLVEGFPDKMRAAHQKTVRYSPKAEADILAALERIVGKHAADAIRKITANSTPPAPPPGQDRRGLPMRTEPTAPTQRNREGRTGPVISHGQRGIEPCQPWRSTGRKKFRLSTMTSAWDRGSASAS